MSIVFQKMLDMSLVGTYCIVCVLLARLFLARISRKYCYLLWAIVFLNLVLPVSLEGHFSLIPAQIIQAPSGISIEGQRSSDLSIYQLPQPQQDQEEQPDAQGATIASPDERNTTGGKNQDDPSGHLFTVFGIVWAIGAGGLLCYQLACLLWFRARMLTKKRIAIDTNVYLCEGIGGPFIRGVFRPKIYLPETLSATEIQYVLAHERCHIKRKDPVFKPIALWIACIHWFNPFVWIAYKLFVNDMEMSCDEAVLDMSGENIKKQYAGTLLRVAASQSGLAYTPLAFGEVSVKSRIKHVLRHTKCSVWVAVAAVAVVLVIMAGLLFRPGEKKGSPLTAMYSPNPTAGAANQVDQVSPSPSSTTIASAFQTSWDERIGDTGMNTAESNKWQERLREDIPHLDEYTVVACCQDDFDRNGTKDLITQVKSIQDTTSAPLSPGAYLCVYMNDDPAYLEAYECGLYGMYLGFMQEPVYGDIDDDGYTEIAFTLFTGGNGGAGSSYKDVLKYTGHSLEKMNLPGEAVEEFIDNDDVGYRIKVLFGSKENEYKAVCDALGQTVVFNAEKADEPDANGNVMYPYTIEDTEVGGNCRGYAGFSIVERDGREYLQATEYLYGEAGIAQCVGYATFLIDWEEGKPSVLEFDMAEVD